MRSVLLTQEPVWRNCQPLPNYIKPWINETGSLTKRLRSVFGQGVAVTVLSQSWRVPFMSECRLLNTREQRVCLVREVLIHLNNTPLVLARTVMPRSSLKINQHLTHLGSRPLGEVLFAYPTLKRVISQTTLISPALWTRQQPQQLAVWGRRTVYDIHHKQLLVSEFFMPKITECHALPDCHAKRDSPR